MRNALPLALVLLLAAIAVAEEARTVRIGKIDWFVDYDDALVVARERAQPLWLHFGENPG